MRRRRDHPWTLASALVAAAIAVGGLVALDASDGGPPPAPSAEPSGPFALPEHDH